MRGRNAKPRRHVAAASFAMPAQLPRNRVLACDVVGTFHIAPGVQLGNVSGNTFWGRMLSRSHA
jgi:hypothetical protein